MPALRKDAGPETPAARSAGVPFRFLRGIAARISALSWLVTLATVGTFVVAIIPQQKSDLLDALESKAKGIASSLHDATASAAITGDYSSVVDQCVQALANDETIDDLVITKNDGFSIIVDRSGWRNETLGAEWRPDARAAIRGIAVLPLFHRRVFHATEQFDYFGMQWGWIHVGLSVAAYDRSVAGVYRRTGLIALMCVSLSLFASIRYARRLVRPILSLQGVVRQVAGGDLSARAKVASEDEIESLADSFNAMADSIQEANETLEARVAERTRELREQIDQKERAHAALAEAQQRLIELSRLSGMAEVATGVLHNVGNVLNSVNVSATLAAERVRESRVDNLLALAGMLQEHTGDLDRFVHTDPKGQRVIPYLVKLGNSFQEDRRVLLEELESLGTNVEHIKEIVATQQNHAKAVGLIDDILIEDLVEDACRIVQHGYERAEISLRREFEAVPRLSADKHQILQILLNLFRNAKRAILDGGTAQRRVTIRIRRAGEERLRIDVQDTGIGLAPEDLTRIFAHGFTTKRDGHGFGLHSGALAAQQMGGALRAESPGLGLGATFILELPFAPPANAPNKGLV